MKLDSLFWILQQYEESKLKGVTNASKWKKLQKTLNPNKIDVLKVTTDGLKEMNERKGIYYVNQTYEKLLLVPFITIFKLLPDKKEKIGEKLKKEESEGKSIAGVTELPPEEMQELLRSMGEKMLDLLQTVKGMEEVKSKRSGERSFSPKHKTDTDVLLSGEQPKHKISEESPLTREDEDLTSAHGNVPKSQMLLEPVKKKPVLEVAVDTSTPGIDEDDALI